MVSKEDNKNKGGFHAMEERTKELQRQAREHEEQEERKAGEKVGGVEERSVKEAEKRT
jgi:hypothetical protein